jgi:hypothetical protein
MVGTLLYEILAFSVDSFSIALVPRTLSRSAPRTNRNPYRRFLLYTHVQIDPDYENELRSLIEALHDAGDEEHKRIAACKALQDRAVGAIRILLSTVTALRAEVELAEKQGRMQERERIAGMMLIPPRKPKTEQETK